MKTNSINYLGIDIPLEDIKVWSWLCEAKNLKGIFQMETQAAASTLRRVQPKNIVDLAVCSALNRPGALRFTDEIGAIRRGEKQVEYPHPRLESILKETLGKYVFQEQLLQTATQLAGYEPKESAKYLKALGKKLPEELAKQQSTFINGMIKNGFEKEFAEKLFEDLKGFANYGFNKCLSPDTIVDTPNGHKPMYELKTGDKILCYNKIKNRKKYTLIKNIYNSKAILYEITLYDGRKIKCSLSHKFLCEDGDMHTLNEILTKKFKIVTD